jgi:hypothetical protein
MQEHCKNCTHKNPRKHDLPRCKQSVPTYPLLIILRLLFLFRFIVAARPKRCPQWAKRLHIRLTGSRAVTNRHTSKAQSPAPGTSCFEIEWDILEGRERSWGLGFGSFFFVFGCLFCVSVDLPVFWLHNLVLHKPFVRYQNSK